ncbi:MAG: hypothetical protein QOE79_2761 [Sphingomonadales bacterium]|jgi:hypothetical protein|nr:hypothetical protein [Sphingomonadales bacterium]MEA3049120.1 hypothetical protein [Sphingomonadales bacterium]
MSGRDWRGLGCAALIGAAAAFPLGMMFANRNAAHQEASTAARGSPPAVKANARNVYSPIVVKDSYVLARQRIVVEALEAQCRDTGDRCGEAKAARRWLNEQN